MICLLCVGPKSDDSPPFRGRPISVMQTNSDRIYARLIAEEGSRTIEFVPEEIWMAVDELKTDSSGFIKIN